MKTVVGVRFKRAGKIYYFDPGEFSPEEGDSVIVETSRGLELGEVATKPKNIGEKEVVKPLKPIKRLATEKDREKDRENAKKKEKDMALCQEKIEKHQLEMKLIDVEYTFDENKIIFYFTAEDRVDFRNLVKDLAGVFRMRIELRQVGVRDEAKIKGGVGNCGRGLCCHEFLPDFHPVSIKMAKNQNLSLNPTKISGICGRLMCCLSYENETYTYSQKGMPKVGERVETPEGLAIVCDRNVLEGKVLCRMIVQEKDESQGEEQKLSGEVYKYGKEEVKKQERNRKNKKNREKKTKEKKS